MLFKHNADTKAANFKRKYDKKIEIIKENENLSCDEKNELYFKIIDKLQRVSDRLDKIEEIATFIHSSNEPLSRNQLLNLGVGCAGVVSLLIGSVGINIIWTRCFFWSIITFW